MAGGGRLEAADRSRAAAYIAGVQRPDGLIPWYDGGPADPWDHVESAMGLSVAGRVEAAERAYRWLGAHQRDDGSFWAVYADGEPARAHRESHHAAYVATGVLHHYLATGDRSFAEAHWAVVEAAVDFAVSLQAPGGEVRWAVDGEGTAWPDALVTGCSSIYKSLECALALARVLGRERPRWAAARDRLGRALRDGGDRFDRTWTSKARYAMDWFYPVLCGAVAGEAARERLAAGADRFVEPGLGCRCVADEPWVTVAETAELVVALAVAGRDEAAERTLGWLRRFADDAGAFWIGYQVEDCVVWPEQRPTWTAGAVLLAADAVFDLTPAAGLFAGDAAATAGR